MRFVRISSVFAFSILAAFGHRTSAGDPTANKFVRDKPNGPGPVICGTPAPVPLPVPTPIPVPTSGPVVRDHRDPIIVRDHRKPGPIIRDHRKPTVIVRDHRTAGTGTWKPSGTSGHVVRSPGGVDASQAPGGVIVSESPRRPIVRDHRRPTKSKRGDSNPLRIPSIPLPKLPIGIPTPF